MPVALISTRTSPAFGPSRSSSTISSGFFAWKATAARVFIVDSILTFQGVAERLVTTPRAFKIITRSSFAHAGRFRTCVGLRLVLVLRRSHARDRVIGAGAQGDVEIVHVAGDVRVIAERGHHVLLRRRDILAAARNHAEQVAL